MPDDEENADMSAIQAIIDESTPEERAKNYKDQGNSALKTGLDLKKKFYLKQAIEQYTLGLDLGCKSMEINVQLLCNRAHVSLLLGNNRNAAEDAKRAVKLDPSSIKAHYRGAKASIALGEFESALEFCTAGLELEPSNDGLAKIAERAKAEGVAHARRRAAEAARQAALRAPAKRLAECLLQRGWRIGRPQFKIEIDKPWQDEEGIVHWPALCFYPEASMEQDVVQDMSENDCIGDHLDVMYGPDAPPLSWDTNGEYSRGSVEMYYLSHAATPLDAEQLTEALFGSWPEAREEGPQRYGDKAARWVRVNEKKTLGEILSSPDLVVPGIPVFFVLSSKTSYKQQFLLGDIPLF